MQQVRFEELLRYGFAGAIGLIALVLGFSGFAKIATAMPAIAQASVLVGAAFALGTLVYAIHRAFFYPLIYRLVLGLLVICRVYCFDKRLLLLLSPMPLEVELDFLRWKRTKEEDYAQPRLTEWGAQVHFLYCSSWTVFLVLWFGTHIGLAPTISEPTLWRVAWFIVGAAFISNCRLAYYDSRLACRDRPNLEKSRATKEG